MNSEKSQLTILGAALCVLAVAGCADRKNLSPLPTISEESKANLSRPVNCATAEQDVDVLEKERASTGKQLLSGVRSVMPISAAVGILMGDYRDRVQVATGQYNNDLDKK